MVSSGRDIDIIRNVKTIDQLKSQMLSDVATLHKALLEDSEEGQGHGIPDKLAGIILTSYLLGNRLGVGFEEVEAKISRNIKLGIIENSDIEKYYGDLSELSKHLDLARLTRGR